MTESKSVLLVEDSSTDALIVKHALRKLYQVDHVRTADEAKALLMQNSYVAMVTDYSLDGMNGLQLLQWAHEQSIAVPVIMVSGQGDERVAAEAIKSGAYEYIVKSVESLSALLVVIQNVLTRHDLERRAVMLQQIVENATDGIVTMGLDGRVLTANRAVEALLGYAPESLIEQPLSLLFPEEAGANNIAEILAAGASGKSWSGELNAKAKAGRVVPMHMSISVLRDAAGRPLHLIGIARDVTERRQLLDRLKRLSITDNLTGLFNHRCFHDRLQYEFERARRYNQPLGCIMIDVDYFKTVNDTHGHLAGDEALKSLAEIIAGATRSVDILARYGGEEFAVLLPNTDSEGTVHCARNIWESVGAAEVRISHTTLRLTISLGVSGLTPDITVADELHRRADAALLSAKRHGRNNVCVWSDVSSQTDVMGVPVEGENLGELRRNLNRLLVPARERYMESARQLLDLLCRRHPVLRRHATNVSNYAVALGMAVGFRPEDVRSLRQAALFHDVGHVATPPEILGKAGPLSDREREVVQEHVMASEALIDELRLFANELTFVRHHHERYDGHGYPDRLSAEQIPLGARILAIADAYDAMTTDRPHRPALSEEEASAELRQNAGSQFDPHLVEEFLRMREAVHAR